MKIFLALLLLAVAAPVFSQTDDPAKILYDSGTRDESAGRLDRAKLTLLTLAATYPESPFTAKVKVELGALYLLMEGRSQVQAGQTRAAAVTFRTVSEVYPESPLAKVAEHDAQALGIVLDPKR